MSNITKTTALFALSFILLLASCIHDDFDRPPVVIPKVDFPSNISIADLKATYSGSGVNFIGDTLLTGLETIIGPVIQGVVVANDESGNLYKTMIIQDKSGGIELKLDQTGLYNEYRVGQRVFIKCSGLYLGNYGGLTQLGYIYQGGIGRIPMIMIKDHLYRDSLPGTPPAAAVKSMAGLSTNDHSTLVKFENVNFDDSDVGLEFAPQLTDATNRILKDQSNNSILVRTSKYSNFSSAKVPAGTGAVAGVLSWFNGVYQLYIRDLNDLIGFDPIAAGTDLIRETFTTPPSSWTIFSMASNKNWEHDAGGGYMKVNGYGGDEPSDDWLISPKVSLSGQNNYEFSFSTWTQYTDNGNPFPVEVIISTDYIGSGNPGPASWTQLPAIFPAPHSQQWTSSGIIDLNAWANQDVYVAFRYRSSGTASSSSSSWRLDNVKITAKP